MNTKCNKGTNLEKLANFKSIHRYVDFWAREVEGLPQFTVGVQREHHLCIDALGMDVDVHVSWDPKRGLYVEISNDLSAGANLGISAQGEPISVALLVVEEVLIVGIANVHALGLTCLQRF